MMDIEQMQANAGEATELLKILANPSRLMVLCALVTREHTAGELEELVGLSQSAVSQHLAKLRLQNIVATRRDGQKIYYSITDGKARALLETLHDTYCGEL
jgi:DNA-binding transcriptional ArsR family regulator